MLWVKAYTYLLISLLSVLSGNILRSGATGHMGTRRDVASIGLYTIMLPYNTFQVLTLFPNMFLFFNFFETGNPGWLRPHYEDQPGFKLRGPSASDSQVCPPCLASNAFVLCLIREDMTMTDGVLLCWPHKSTGFPSCHSFLHGKK